MKIEMTSAKWNQGGINALLCYIAPEALAEAQAGFDALQKLIADLKASRDWKGEAGEVLVLYRPRGFEVERLILVGLDSDVVDPDLLRRSVMKAVLRLKGARIGSLGVSLPGVADTDQLVRITIDGLKVGLHNVALYQAEPRPTPSIARILFLERQAAEKAHIDELSRRTAIVAEAVNLARTLTTQPGNQLNPESLAAEMVRVGRDNELDVEVLEEVELDARGFGAVLAVGQGSSIGPRLVVVQHRGNPASDETVCLVGKGVTFDSGGISIKPSQSMEEMKNDKAGACSVLATMQAVAQLKVKKNVVAVIPLVENLPGGRALRPGDVIRSFSGKTIEVINTDAEGRLILADALAYARQVHEPKWIVDVATLTGACVVALGHVRAGYFSNDDALARSFEAAIAVTGEKFWRLPLDREYREELKSEIADVKNLGSRWGGAITAAKFLEEFVGPTPWCHIDMAGMDTFASNNDIRGPRGFAVRTLLEFVERN